MGDQHVNEGWEGILKSFIVMKFGAYLPYPGFNEFDVEELYSPDLCKQFLSRCSISANFYSVAIPISNRKSLSRYCRLGCICQCWPISRKNISRNIRVIPHYPLRYLGYCSKSSTLISVPGLEMGFLYISLCDTSMFRFLKVNFSNSRF